MDKNKYNDKILFTLDFMHRYGGFEFVIEDGRITGAITEKGPVRVSKQDQ